MELLIRNIQSPAEFRKKSCLERAGVKNPMDMDNIKLALQSYNYGNGYLEWAKARGGYTLANAAEFSDTMAKKWGGAVMEKSQSFHCAVMVCYGLKAKVSGRMEVPHQLQE